MTRQQRYFRTPKGRAALARAKRKYRAKLRIKIKSQKWADTKRLLGIQEATQC
jgi:hypothetical protein